MILCAERFHRELPDRMARELFADVSEWSGLRRTRLSVRGSAGRHLSPREWGQGALFEIRRGSRMTSCARRTISSGG